MKNIPITSEELQTVKVGFIPTSILPNRAYRRYREPKLMNCRANTYIINLEVGKISKVRHQAVPTGNGKFKMIHHYS